MTRVRPTRIGANGEPDFNLNPSERAVFGCSVSVREQASGRTRSLHRVGPVGEALLELVGEIDALDGEWRVIAISNPITIMRDLYGRERALRGIGRTGPSYERSMLGRLGRRDLLDTRLDIVTEYEGHRALGRRRR